jgi:hypothetical protein
MYPIMRKKVFWKTEVPKEIKSYINLAVGIAYLSAYLMLAAGKSIDALIVFGLGLGIHLGKSRVCAIILTTDFIISKIITILVDDTFNSGIFLMILSTYYFIKCIIATFKYQKLWKSYINGEYVPLSIANINKEISVYSEPQKQNYDSNIEEYSQEQ